MRKYDKKNKRNIGIILVISALIIVMFSLVINLFLSRDKNEYKVYPVYYPVGNGIFNIDKSIEDIKWIIENEIKKEEQNLLREIL